MIITIIILIFISFFFSKNKTTLTTTNKTKFKTKTNKNNKKTKNIIKLLKKPNKFITTILIKNNITNILLPTLITIITLH